MAPLDQSFPDNIERNARQDRANAIAEGIDPDEHCRSVLANLRSRWIHSHFFIEEDVPVLVAAYERGAQLSRDGA